MVRMKGRKNTRINTFKWLILSVKIQTDFLLKNHNREIPANGSGFSYICYTIKKNCPTIDSNEVKI